jgi:hypothetical protein
MLMQFLSINKTDFVCNGKRVELKGVGLGNWLMLEHFMFGMPGSEVQIRQAVSETYGVESSEMFWDAYYENYMGEEDIRFVQECGMNHVRIAVNSRLFLGENFAESPAVRQIDRIIPFLRKYGVWGILDIHAVPGGQNPDWHSDNSSGMDNFWSDDSAQKEIVDLWGRIARYYKDEPAIGGYDLINEPCYFMKDSERGMLNFFKQCTEGIRKHDSRHIIFYSGNTYSRDFSMFAENMDEQCAYTFHLYPFLQLPGETGDVDVDGKLERCLRKDVSYDHLRETLKKPLWCGETGHPLHGMENVGILHSFVKLLEKENIGWALWPLKDRGAMGMLSAKSNGAWNQLCEKVSESWNFWELFTQDSILSAQKEKDPYAYYRQLAGESSRGWEIVRKNLKTLPFEELMEGVKDFSFKNCTKNSGLGF